jgi:membrane protein DedA with SNARE-associated domain
MIKAFFKGIAAWYMLHVNYGTVMFLMALESTFIPVPSELVIPPAVWKACDPGSSMSVLLVVLFGTLGCVIGSLINYFLAVTLGRKIIYALADSKYARIFLIKRKSIENAEAYFIRHGNSSTFIGRFVPGVRHLISIPAGLARMNLKNFILFTALGSGLWNIILAILGYVTYSNRDLLEKYMKEISWGLLFIGIVFVAYLIIRYKKKHD